MTTETMREAVARAIEPRPFQCWASMVDFCLKQGDDDQTARHFADQTHGADIQAALQKADAAIRTVLERLREYKLVMREDGMVVHEVRGEPNDVWQAMLDAAAREVG